MNHTILRLPAVFSDTGLSRITIYLRIAQGVFTHPVSLGARAVGWPAHEVVAINAARIAGKSEPVPATAGTLRKASGHSRGILVLGVCSDLLALPASRLGGRLKLSFARNVWTCRSLAHY